MRGKEAGENERHGETKTEVVNPDAPVKFLRVFDDENELAMIPWDEAEIIAEAVRVENNDEQ